MAGQIEEGNIEAVLKLLLLLGYYFGCLVYTSLDFCIRIHEFELKLADILEI